MALVTRITQPDKGERHVASMTGENRYLSTSYVLGNFLYISYVNNLYNT